SIANQIVGAGPDKRIGDRYRADGAVLAIAPRDRALVVCPRVGGDVVSIGKRKDIEFVHPGNRRTNQRIVGRNGAGNSAHAASPRSATPKCSGERALYDTVAVRQWNYDTPDAYVFRGADQRIFGGNDTHGADRPVSPGRRAETAVPSETRDDVVAVRQRHCTVVGSDAIHRRR